MKVYVIHQNGTPLMPTSPRVARRLLQAGRAKVILRTPFTIKLTYDSTSYTQPLTLGVDTGSAVVGTAVVNNKNEVLYVSEVAVRNNITKNMTRRSTYRRTRRCRKCRCRPARWSNRANSIKADRFNPTIRSKIDSHIKEINFVKSILPIAKTIIETAKFDPHALKNPAVLQNKTLYQHGTKYGFENTKAYVLHRDGHICQQCESKKKNMQLEVHHIIPRANQGSDDESNLITLCNSCHYKLHHGQISKLKKQGKVKGTLSHATQMNSICKQIVRKLPNSIECFGYETKVHRYELSLPKEHVYDAVAIACYHNNFANQVSFKTNQVMTKVCNSKGDYRQTKGVRSEQKLETGKTQGFRKFDKVQYRDDEYFIKGKISTGYAVLMSIDGIVAKFDNPKTAKMKNMKRIGARKAWMVTAKIL